MTKKNLKPQQAAPVQREINTTSTVGDTAGTGLIPLRNKELEEQLAKAIGRYEELKILGYWD